MARPIGPRKRNRYSESIRATAVRLSGLPRVKVQDVSISLDVHPFALSRYRGGMRASARGDANWDRQKRRDESGRTLEGKLLDSARASNSPRHRVMGRSRQRLG
jgi:hypothetical protein